MKNEDIGMYVFLAGLLLILVGIVWMFFYHNLHIETVRMLNLWRIEFLKYWAVVSPPGKLTLFGVYLLVGGIFIGGLDDK